MKKVEIPSKCPSCYSELTRINDQLFCTNVNCNAMIAKKILHYAQIVGIKGLGPKTIEKLGITSIKDLYTITEEDIIDTIGSKLGQKLIVEIDKARHLNQSIFIQALNIPLVGRSVASKISKPLDELTEQYLYSVGIGPKATSNILNFINDKKHILPVILTINDEIKEANNSYIICITGRISGYTKAQLASELLNYNIKTIDNVTKDTNFVICDLRKDSGKEKLAEKYNIPIVTYKEFKEILNND